MKNYFEITISLNGKHLFSTAPKSIRTKDQYDKVIEILKKKFPHHQGFEITAEYVEVIPQGIEVM